MNALEDDALAEITGFLATQHDIRLGIVFGSLITDKTRPDSDLDLAVLGVRSLGAERRAELIAELARLTGRPVDLVDLENAGITIARSAVLGGKVVFSRDSAVYPAQVSRVLLDSADFLPYRERLLKERREAWIR